MKLCLEYYLIKFKGQQKIFIVKISYITGVGLSKLFGFPKETQYKNLTTAQELTSVDLAK